MRHVIYRSRVGTAVAPRATSATARSGGRRAARRPPPSAPPSPTTVRRRRRRPRPRLWTETTRHVRSGRVLNYYGVTVVRRGFTRASTAPVVAVGAGGARRRARERGVEEGSGGGAVVARVARPPALHLGAGRRTVQFLRRTTAAIVASRTGQARENLVLQAQGKQLVLLRGENSSPRRPSARSRRAAAARGAPPPSPPRRRRARARSRR